MTGTFGLTARLSCRTGDTVAASVEVRVFRLAAFGVHACRRPAGRPALLATESVGIAPSRVETVRIAGPFVAFSTWDAWKCTSWSVHVHDVRARRTVRSRESVTTREANGCTSTTAIVSLVLASSGAIAWTEAPGDAGTATVRALDDRGDRILDAGPDVDPASLRLDGADTVSWIRGGRPQTTPLSWQRPCVAAAPTP
jgi:hypothetical protein